MSGVSGGSDLVDLEGRVRAVTDTAILFHSDDDESAWLPRSQIQVEGEIEVGERVKIALPEWLAVEKGLV